jgi:hypothetical protein
MDILLSEYEDKHLPFYFKKAKLHVIITFSNNKFVGISED